MAFNKAVARRYWQESIDAARRTAQQAKENQDAGRCESAYYSVSAYHGFSGAAHGIASALFEAGAITAQENRAMDVDTGYSDIMDVEKKCGWYDPPAAPTPDTRSHWPVSGRGQRR